MTDEKKLVPITESLAVALGRNLGDLYRLSKGKLDGPGDKMLRALLLEYDEWHDREGAYEPKAGEITGYRVVPEESTWRRAGDIKPGDVLDLEGDPIAERIGESNHPSFEFEYVTVESVELETPNCVVIYSSEINCGFPVDHLLKFVRHDPEAADGVDYLSAHCYSDDRHVEIVFNAAPWFEQAGDDEIRALFNAQWGGDYEADSVAEHFETTTTKPLFDYLATKPTMGSDPVGFECHIQPDAALAWLEKYRPALHAELMATPDEEPE